MKRMFLFGACLGLAVTACSGAPSHGECAGGVEQHPVQIWEHIPYGTPVTWYNSNPPSSGPHYPWWASYGPHSTPLDAREYVHNLEHGAVVLLYNCALTDHCPEIVRAMNEVISAVGPDPLCADNDTPARVVIAPAPDLDVPIAAASWGWTYRSTCLDAASLTAFAKAHYGQGREANCAEGAGY